MKMACLIRTKAVNSWGLDMSVATSDEPDVDVAAPLALCRLAAGRDGVADGVTFRGSAAEEGGGILQRRQFPTNKWSS